MINHLNFVCSLMLLTGAIVFGLEHTGLYVQPNDVNNEIISGKSETSAQPEQCLAIKKTFRHELQQLQMDIKDCAYGNKLPVIKDQVEQVRQRISDGHVLHDTIVVETRNMRANISSYNENINRFLSLLLTTQKQLEMKKNTGCNLDSLLLHAADINGQLRYYLNEHTGLLVDINALLLENFSLIDALSLSINENLYAYMQDIEMTYSSLQADLLTLRERFGRRQEAGKYYSFVQRAYTKRLNSIDNELEKLLSDIKMHIEVVHQGFFQQTGLERVPLSNQTRQTIQHVQEFEAELAQNQADLHKKVVSTHTDQYPWLIHVSIGFGAIVIIFGFWFYIRAYHVRVKNKVPDSTEDSDDTISDVKESQEQVVFEEGKTKIGGLTITRQRREGGDNSLIIPGKGLKYMDEAGMDNYYMIDLREYWEDTMVTKVFLHRHLIRKTYRFFYESCVSKGRVLETGGYIIGGWEADPDNPQVYHVSLEDFIQPGDDAIYGEYELNFGAKIGVRLEKAIREYREKPGREYTLTAWFHSHPEIKIFLSNNDILVQEALAGRENKHKLLALVIDPITQDKGKVAFYTGIFPYRTDETMNNSSSDMKLIKWKDLYDWALSPPILGLDDYYRVDLELYNRQSYYFGLLLNDRCITRFSLFLDDLLGQESGSGLFLGRTINQNNSRPLLLLEDFVEADKEPGVHALPLVGYFYFSLNIDDIVDEIVSDIERTSDTGLIMLCDNHHKDMMILTRQTSGRFNRPEDMLMRFTFSDAEPWPTRRR